MTLGEKIKWHRKEKKMTQKDLGEQLGLSYMTLRRWEIGEREPTLTQISQIAEILGAPLNDFINIPPPSEPLQNTRPLRGDVIEVPVLSSEGIACCSGKIEESDILRYAIIPREWLDGPEGDKPPYIFYIQRDSMDPLIKIGEGLLINPNLEVTHGEIAICCWNGYVMVRGVFFEPNGDIRLLAKNPAYEDVIITAEDAPNVLKFGGVITTCIGRARPIKGFF